MNYGEIIQRSDGSFVIDNGMYHVPNNEEFAEQYLDVAAYAAANPEMVTPETIQQYEPTPEELAAQRLAAIDARLAELDTASVRPLRAIVDGSATDADAQKLAGIEEEVEALRVERANLLYSEAAQ